MIKIKFETIIIPLIQYIIKIIERKKIIFTGGEVDVIKSFPWERIKVDVIIVEHEIVHIVTKQNIYDPTFHYM